MAKGSWDCERPRTSWAFSRPFAHLRALAQRIDVAARQDHQALEDHLQSTCSTQHVTRCCSEARSRLLSRGLRARASSRSPGGSRACRAPPRDCSRCRRRLRSSSLRARPHTMLRGRQPRQSFSTAVLATSVTSFVHLLLHGRGTSDSDAREAHKRARRRAGMSARSQPRGERRRRRRLAHRPFRCRQDDGRSYHKGRTAGCVDGDGLLADAAERRVDQAETMRLRARQFGTERAVRKTHVARSQLPPLPSTTSATVAKAHPPQLRRPNDEQRVTRTSCTPSCFCGGPVQFCVSLGGPISSPYGTAKTTCRRSACDEEGQRVSQQLHGERK